MNKKEFTKGYLMGIRFGLIYIHRVMISFRTNTKAYKALHALEKELIWCHDEEAKESDNKKVMKIPGVRDFLLKKKNRSK